MVRDSVSALMDDPLVVHDLNLNSDDITWSDTNIFEFGGTSIVETDYSSGTGAVYYLVNDAENYKGPGVGMAELVDGVPSVTHRFGDSGWWWSGDSTPKYDVAAHRDPKSEYIYILGNRNSESGFSANSYVYQASVSADDAFNPTTPIDKGLVYAGLAYPHLDKSGETFTIGFTNNNRIQIIKGSFS
ncbi:hypothetical protein EDB80DRAFT_805724 [Ilyonectria destructans]|nr:hypothetical protein EDB80DRAFT_805724 [Ilyonectria destructans]